MKSISGKALCKVVERNGWLLERVTGSHHIYAKKGVSAILSISVHSNRDLPAETLRNLLKDADLTEDDLE